MVGLPTRVDIKVDEAVLLREDVFETRIQTDVLDEIVVRAMVFDGVILQISDDEIIDQPA